MYRRTTSLRRPFTVPSDLARNILNIHRLRHDRCCFWYAQRNDATAPKISCPPRFDDHLSYQYWLSGGLWQQLRLISEGSRTAFICQTHNPSKRRSFFRSIYLGVSYCHPRENCESESTQSIQEMGVHCDCNNTDPRFHECHQKYFVIFETHLKHLN